MKHDKQSNRISSMSGGSPAEPAMSSWPASVFAKAASRARRTIAFFTPGSNIKESKATNQQTASPLFHLPLEIREPIWEYALIPPPGADSAHFHIYDDVYNSCTYDERPLLSYSEGADRRRHPTQMSLLMTCRAIYSEALQLLYDNSHFTLVVCPGLARPYDSIKTEYCRRVGNLKQCRELFGRMRHAAIIVQPSKRPYTPKYVARISTLLSVLDYGQHLNTLCILFNFHVQMQKYDPEYVRRGAIIESFYPLQEHIAANLASDKLQLTIKAWSVDRNTWHPKFVELWSKLGGEMEAWHPLYPAEIERIESALHQEGNVMCLQRGAFGHFGMNRYRTRKLKKTEYITIGACAALYFLTFPVSMPLMFGAEVVKRKIKGEW